jgi:pyrroline-5-carboxylate reductase
MPNMARLSRLAIVGMGNMGEALVKGLLDRELLTPAQLAGAEKLPGRAQEIERRYGIPVMPSVAAACAGADTVVLAVKPQDANAILPEVARAAPGTLVISICAGVTLGQLLRGLGDDTPVARVMPNTPALVGCGASVYCASTTATPDHHRLVQDLLGAVGEVHRVEDEGLLDPVTGLSGSGPAYVFAFLEALADGGVLAGLPRPLARALALQTVEGAARLARESGEHTAELKDRVASPGGTTIAGLHALERGWFRNAVIEAVLSATRRCRELGG